MAALLISFCGQSQAANPTLLLFGGKDHDVFLGCLNCSRTDPTSVWNAYGKYGSEYQSNSIWNRYGTYGSVYNQNSPWNTYSSQGPVIVDPEGNSYGYFTRNKYHQQTRIDWVVWILDHYDEVIEHLDEVRENF